MSTEAFIRCAECKEQTQEGINHGAKALLCLADSASLLCLLHRNLEASGIFIPIGEGAHAEAFEFAIDHAPHQSFEIIDEHGTTYVWELKELREVRRDES